MENSQHSAWRLADTNGAVVISITVTITVIAIIWNWAATESSVHQAAPREAIGYWLSSSQGHVNKVILVLLEIISTSNPCALQGGPLGTTRGDEEEKLTLLIPVLVTLPTPPRLTPSLDPDLTPHGEGNRPEFILWMQGIKTLYNKIVLNSPWAVEMTFFSPLLLIDKHPPPNRGWGARDGKQYTKQSLLNEVKENVRSFLSDTLLGIQQDSLSP